MGLLDQVIGVLFSEGVHFLFLFSFVHWLGCCSLFSFTNVFLMKEIPLPNGLVTQVDDEDYEWLSQWNWGIKGNSKDRKKYTDYVRRWHGGPFMHRVIMNPPKGMVVDHIDGNGLNNQRSNLRICTNAENIRNCKNKVGSVSKYRGVSINNQKFKKLDGSVSCYKTWKAVICANGKSTFLGCHKTEEDAALAYNRAAIKLHGEFARLNKIQTQTLKEIGDE